LLSVAWDWPSRCPGNIQNVVVNARLREQKRNRWQVALPRTRPAASFARHLLLDWVSRWVSHGTLADVEYAVGEALANSAEHGGGSIMTLSCWRDAENVVVEISDRGGGFEPTLRDAGQRLNDRGFGLHLMHALSDGVEFFDGGRRVRVRKHLREDDVVFRNNVRRQSKRRAFREFTRRVITRLVSSRTSRRQ
jgi:anti-sigma regulatory factor (Ser/Thr protein kinase)